MVLTLCLLLALVRGLILHFLVLWIDPFDFSLFNLSSLSALSSPGVCWSCLCLCSLRPGLSSFESSWFISLQWHKTAEPGANCQQPWGDERHCQPDWLLPPTDTSNSWWEITFTEAFGEEECKLAKTIGLKFFFSFQVLWGNLWIINGQGFGCIFYMKVCLSSSSISPAPNWELVQH